MSTVTTEAESFRGWRRWGARLALLLTVFGGIQPALAGPIAPGALRYVDISFNALGGGARHNHNHTLCHRCAGHVCLEQHGAFDHSSTPLFLPPPDYALPIPRMQLVLWPHPPTAPPLRRIAQTPQARAPPFLA